MGRTAGILLTGILVVSGTAAAFAAVGDRGDKAGAKGPRERGQNTYLMRLDRDNDKAVTLDEYLKRRTETFTRQDKNQDGVLEESELALGGPGRRVQNAEQRLQTLMQRLDQDGDGKLTRAEFERDPVVAGGKADRAGKPASLRAIERQKQLFAFYDRNADGVLETAEYEAARDEERAYRKRRALHILDRNDDGKVTLEEYTADARSRFLRLDLDRDGRITALDLPPIERQRWSQR